MIDYSEKNNDPNAAPAGQAPQSDSTSDVLIHVMPEQFRSGGAGQGAKSTGMAILIGGVVLLVVGGGAIYYFMFKSPSLPQPQPQKSVDTASTTKQADVPKSAQPTSTPVATLAIASSSALGTATTTKATSSAVATPTANSEAIVPSTDSDHDGLTDEEETAIGTDKNSQDSDGDGFGDFVELQGGYDPAGPGKLVSNSKLKTSNQKSFTILYPAAWTEKTAGGDYLLLWQSPDNQMVQINTEKLTEPANILDWYKQRFSVSDIPVDRIITKKDDSGTVNWTGVKSSDGLAIYLINGKNGELYTVSYNPGLDSVIKYPNLFQAMVNSLTLK